MTRLAHRRGQPLVALCVVLGLWIGARAALVGPSDDAAPPPVVAAAAPLVSPPAPAPALPAWRAGNAQLPPAPGRALPLAVRQPVYPPAPRRLSPRLSPRLAGGHQLLWLAGLAALPLPDTAQPLAGPGAPAGRDMVQTAPPAAHRWSADGWLLWRPGSHGTPSAGLARYGASQAGAVVRFALRPAGRLAPQAYLRATRALAGPPEDEVALGLAAKPLAALPVVAMAEVRSGAGHSGPRAAAALVSAVPPANLPGGLRGETWLAAGYVGGRDATGWVDGQARIDRAITRAGPGELRAGAGAWGGAQRGAGRLDLGPSASLALPLGAGFGRVSADWRFRLAGSAAPASGPAITLSAGF